MNTVPMSTLIQCLAALKAAHARLNDPATPDPYMAVLKAKIELEYHLKHMPAVEVTNV